MISFLSGTIHSIGLKSITLLTESGVGYEVIPTGSLLAKCKEQQPLVADIFTVVREQEITLYGFGGIDEKTLFIKLIGVSGIGPKTAISMVSTPIDKFLEAISNGDIAYITKMPGIGKKTAERLIIELRGKLDLSKTTMLSTPSHQTKEATEALQNLGYNAQTIGEVLKKAPHGISTEELIKFFLSSSA